MQGVSTEQTLQRSRRLRRQRKHKKPHTTLIIGAGALAWGVLGLNGHGGPGLSVAIVGGVLALAAAEYWANKPSRRQAGHDFQGKPVQCDDPMVQLFGRRPGGPQADCLWSHTDTAWYSTMPPAPRRRVPNAVTEEYNTYIPRKAAPSPSASPLSAASPNRTAVAQTMRPSVQPLVPKIQDSPLVKYERKVESPASKLFPGTTEPSATAEPPRREAPAPAPEPSVKAETTPEPTPEAVRPADPLPAITLKAPSTPAPRPRPEPRQAPVTEQAPPRRGRYQLPTADMLPMPTRQSGPTQETIQERIATLEKTLRTFGVEAKVVNHVVGPAVTRYEVQPGEGVRVNKFTALADDIALALAALSVRIEAPIPGKSVVGIEVPNKVRGTVSLREVVESPAFESSTSRLTIVLGKDNAGREVIGDLAKMPHLLIAGSTGSGKSVCMNTIICSLLFKARPDEVKMLMVDPKMVELSCYNGIPHLIAPVVTDPKKAAGYLKGMVKEMEARYELFAAAAVRNIEQYNQEVAADPGPDPEHPRQPLPYIVILIDELADLMMVAPADVEDAICRLAQMARACGMHLVIATQSPRVDVITGLIKANIPSRIAFAVSSQVDSRVILDYAGAERLLGKGDMLYHPAGLSKPIRAQGAFIDEASVDELVRFCRAQGEPEYTAEEIAVDAEPRRGLRGGEEGQAASAVEAALPEALRVVIQHGQASVSILQRRLRCNYSKAARLIDLMEERGFIGPHQGSKPREVLITLAQCQEMFGDAAEDEPID